MSTAINVNLQGFGQISTALDRLSTLDQQDMLEAVGSAMVSHAQERVAETKTDPDGNKWSERSKQTKAKHGNHSLLHRDGDLRDSLASHLEGGQVVIGSNLIYAAIHQFGGKAGRGHSVTIPARPFVGLSNDNKQEVESILLNFIGDALNG